MFSGGSDSEVVVRSFADQKIQITATICQFNDNLNIHDISYAIVCCEQLNVPYKIVPLNIISFLTNGEYLRYTEPTHLNKVALCSSFWLAEQVNEAPVMGGNCHLMKRNCHPEWFPNTYDSSPWDLYEFECFSSWYKYFSLPGRERVTVPKFFQYTPEIILSYLSDRMIVDMVHDKFFGFSSTENKTKKINFYRQHFPLLPRPKYTGYERINRDLLNGISRNLRHKFKGSGVVQIEYNDLLKVLKGEQPMHECSRSVTELELMKMKYEYLLNNGPSFSRLSPYIEQI